MMHFRRMMETLCCKQYMCEVCVYDLIQVCFARGHLRALIELRCNRGVDGRQISTITQILWDNEMRAVLTQLVFHLPTLTTRGFFEF